MDEKRDAVPLREFFAAMERRLEKRFPGQWPSFRVEVCGRLIELRFLSRRDAEMARGGLRRCISPAARTPDAVFKYWQDDCTAYVGPAAAVGRWKKRDGGSWLSFVEGGGLLGGDTEKGVFYHCGRPRPAPDKSLLGHPMYILFHRWARSEGLLMLHGAAVGAGGRGVLLAGRGGAGKSTLSVSCLLCGMEFISDDYLLLRGSGPAEAMPLYSSVGLNPDMCGLLRPDMPLLGVRKDGKLMLDASGRPFAPRLAIRAILAPSLGDTPSIRPAAGEGPLVRVVHSSLMQFSDGRDTDFVRAVSARLRDLPAFEFCQGRDFRENAEFLRQFIEKEL